MVTSYLTFIRKHFGYVALFVLLILLSVPGQTFFLSLYSDYLLSAYGVSSAELGAIFAIATFGSAIGMATLGKMVDSTSLAALVLGTGGTLALVCLSFSLPVASAVLLTFMVFCLRFLGQGMFLHISHTAIAKMLPAYSGKMLAIAGTLFSLFTIIIPITMVGLIEAAGWQKSLGLVGLAVACGTLGAVGLLRTYGRQIHKVPSRKTAQDPAGAKPDLNLMWRFCPVMVIFSFVFTGLLFHQAALAYAKGWSVSWLAACFSVFAFSKAVSSFVFGEVIDRMGPKKIVPYFLLPALIGIAVLIFIDSPIAAIIYLALFGVSAAIDIKLGTILWQDLYSPATIGYVRSQFEAARIVATGLAPFVVGWLLDSGVGMDQQLFACSLVLSGIVVYAKAICP